MIVNFINCKSLNDDLRVLIYNDDYRCIYNHVNKSICINLCDGIYKLQLSNRYGIINTYIFIYKNNTKLNIYYNYYVNNKRKIILTDYHYKGLKIERGIINLCQKV